MASYNHFISQNVAPVGARDIGVYQNGEKIGRIPLGSLTPPNRRKRLYSFGVMSDTHTGMTEDEAKKAAENPDGLPSADVLELVARRKKTMETALRYLRNEGVDFICITGDLVGVGSLKSCWDDYAEALKGAGDVPVHAITGNHEMLCSVSIGIEALARKHTGYGYDGTGEDGVCRSFEHNGDVFIFLGAYIQFSKVDNPFLAYDKENDIKRIEQKFSENRNKRCFVFQHPAPADASHDTYYTLPLSMYHDHKNISVFHGHTHDEFEKQTAQNKGANYKNDGFRSVHVPALVGYGQGYIADVYEDGYHLRGMNLVTGAEIPIANYWIDTAIQAVDKEY